MAEHPEIAVLWLDDHSHVTVGRLDLARGVVHDVHSDPALSLDSLDRAVADHLVRIGRVGKPETPEWRAELFDLVARGRERLRDAEGTFMMGNRHIRLFRMTRHDVFEADSALRFRTEDLACAAVAGVHAPALAVADSVAAWPGLRDAVAGAVGVPIIELEPMGISDAMDADAMVSDAVVADVVAPPDSVSSEEPRRDAGSRVDAESQVAARSQGVESRAVETPTEVCAVDGGAAKQVSGEHVPAAVAPAEGPPPAPIEAPGAVPAPEVSPQRPATPISAVPEDVSPQLPSSRRTRRPRRPVLIGLALICALAVIGVAVVLSATGDPADPAAAPAPPTTSSSTGPAYADPAIYAEARQPAKRYTPPPPPETTEQPAPRPRPRSPRPQRGITIPNPIPGLPPIVLP
ncbi:hypothetical protein [Gordonia paraffinivorans]|uniref:hypothetical protein n=1 Tax=Gordonia paraffinivorans TaxID=175628 RepID=UPI001FD5C9A8|nr:hypothetical protein [Gordonia paraffinivorans]